MHPFRLGTWFSRKASHVVGVAMYRILSRTFNLFDVSYILNTLRAKRT